MSSCTVKKKSQDSVKATFQLLQKMCRFCALGIISTPIITRIQSLQVYVAHNYSPQLFDSRDSNTLIEHIDQNVKFQISHRLLSKKFVLESIFLIQFIVR